jgi:outer membrane lipoprotein-sorting protein
MQAKKFKNILLFSLILSVSLFFSTTAMSQTDPLIEKVSQKLAQVNDYVAEGVM